MIILSSCATSSSKSLWEDFPLRGKFPAVFTLTLPKFKPGESMRTPGDSRILVENRVGIGLIKTAEFDDFIVILGPLDTLYSLFSLVNL